MLEEGQLNTALALSTVFSEKYKGRSMQPGEAAEVRLPSASGCGGTAAWTARLLSRAGSREAAPFIWLGDEAAGDRTLYVAFGPLRKKRQFLKIWNSGTQLVEEMLPPDDTDPLGAPPRVLRISGYIKGKLDKLWDHFGFGAQLDEAARKHPGHRLLFAGISHGASLAQAAAVRFALLRPKREVCAATWNGYKWTDPAGAALAGRLLGPRLLPLVLSKGGGPGEPRRWDSVVEYPPGFAPMPGALLVDVDTGAFLSCVLGDTALGPSFAWRMAELHFAKTAFKAMQASMLLALRLRAAAGALAAPAPGYALPFAVSATGEVSTELVEAGLSRSTLVEGQRVLEETSEVGSVEDDEEDDDDSPPGDADALASILASAGAGQAAAGNVAGTRLEVIAGKGVKLDSVASECW